MKKLAKSMVGQFYGIRTLEKPLDRDSELEKKQRKKQRHRIKTLLGPTSDFLQDEARVRDVSLLFMLPDLPTEG